MKVNWPERLWVNSPVRRYVQQREARFFKKMQALPPGAKGLEIGCGCGVGANIIYRAFSPGSIQAIDIDEGFLITASFTTWRTGRRELQKSAGYWETTVSFILRKFIRLCMPTFCSGTSWYTLEKTVFTAPNSEQP